MIAKLIIADISIMSKERFLSITASNCNKVYNGYLSTLASKEILIISDFKTQSSVKPVCH